MRPTKARVLDVSEIARNLPHILVQNWNILIEKKTNHYFHNHYQWEFKKNSNYFLST